MKRDLLFILERLTSLLDENRLTMLARQRGIRQKRDDGGIGKIFAALLRQADEGMLSRLMVVTAILLAASRTNAAAVLRDAASAYKVDTEAITLKVKREFAVKEKTKAVAQEAAKTMKKVAAGIRSESREPAIGRLPAALSAIRNVWSAAVLQAKSEDSGLVCANVSGL